jgi:hypothetical protein
MLSGWHRRKERQQQVIRDSDNLMALARVRHEDEAGSDPSHWFAVRREIARHVTNGTHSILVFASRIFLLVAPQRHV